MSCVLRRWISNGDRRDKRNNSVLHLIFDKLILAWHRLWRTWDYTLEQETSELFSASIACLSFCDGRNDALTAVSNKGRLLQFTFVSDEHRAGREKQEACVTGEWSLPKAGNEFDFSSWVIQFSEDGRTLLFHSQKSLSIRIIRLKGDQRTGLLSLPPATAFGIPVLSPNGESFLDCNCADSLLSLENFRNCIVRVLPGFDFDQQTKTKEVSIEGDRAAWGRKGEYLLVWNSFSESPNLSVYKTMNLKPFGSDPLIACKPLELGFATTTAFMLESDTHEHAKVLICDISKAWKLRSLIWDIIDDVVVKEVGFDMPLLSLSPEMDLPEASRTESILQDPAIALFDKYMKHVKEVVFPQFCLSRDEACLGIYAQKRLSCSCAIASMKTGAIQWTCSLPDMQSIDQLLTGSQASFDPCGKHFVVHCPRIIVSCPLSSLTVDRSADRDKVQEAGQVRLDNSTLPGRAVSESALAELSSEAAVCAVVQYAISEISVDVQPIEDRMVAARFLDASVTTGKYKSVLLARDCNKEIVMVNEVFSPDFGQFPLNLEDFYPRRVFIYQRASEETIVVLSTDPSPKAVFCDMTPQESKVVPSELSPIVQLDMTNCHRVSQTQDSSQLVLLGDKSVVIFDFEEQQTVDSIPYEIDFGSILRLVQESTKWNRWQFPYGSKDTERRMSDDGQAVLLAWDTKNQRSIVVTPLTQQIECENNIKLAEGCLSDFCALSRNANYTTFIDVEDLAIGRVTVGVFNERGMH